MKCENHHHHQDHYPQPYLSCYVMRLGIMDEEAIKLYHEDFPVRD